MFEALSEPARPAGRQWLHLFGDETQPEVLDAQAPAMVLWSSLWSRCPSAEVRFDIEQSGSGSTVRWTLLADVNPGPSLVGHMCKRLNQMINAELRYSFGN